LPNPLYAVFTKDAVEGAVNAVTGRGDKQEPDEQDVLLEVNAHVHEAARRFEGIAPGEDRWDFTCECGATGCRVTVSLRLAEYEALRVEGRPVLAPGHEKHP
jgi:hypothetical protein